MAERKNTAEKVVPLFRRSAEVDDVRLGRPLRPAVQAPASATAQALDLSGRPKVIMAIGSGSTGKSTLLKWLAGRAIREEKPLLLASVDPENRELKDYFQVGSVHEPPTFNPTEMTGWLEEFLRFAAEEKVTAAIDFGGGDSTLTRLVAEAPDLADMLEEAGVSPVAIYMLSPRLSDLSVLATLEGGGFRPRATALVKNEGRVNLGTSSEAAFERTTRQPVYRAAVARGAVEIWMPVIHGTAAKEAEDRRLRFEDARDGKAKEGSKAGPLGPFDRSRIRAWLNRMEEEFAPISSWLL